MLTCKTMDNITALANGLLINQGEVRIKMSLETLDACVMKRPGIFIKRNTDFQCPGVKHIKSKQCYVSGNEQIQFMFFDNVSGFAYRRIIFNSGAQPVNIKAVRELIELPDSPEFYPDKDLLCFHAENTRLYEVFTTSVNTDPTTENSPSFDDFEPVSGTSWAGEGNFRKEVGCSPFQPFPAMIYARRDSGKILLDGTLTQRRFYRYYDVEGDRLVWGQRAKTVESFVAGSREKFTGEWNYVEFSNSNDLNHPYGGYLTALCNFGEKYRGEISTNRNTVVWGSWNHGIHRNINQEDLLKTADFLKENFPAVKWFQIDDGYDEYDYSVGNNRIGLGIFHHGESVSRKKFPNGMRCFVNEIKKRGLRPSIWTSLTVSTERAPFKDNPDWFIRCYQNPRFAIYDISKQEVRNFIQECFHRIIEEWGFEGIKLDFWSYFFEDEQFVIPAGKITGGNYRQWLFDVIRDVLPDDGYLQLGCDIAMGNPHLGKWTDNYRYGIDIGGGNWNNVKVNAKWAAFCMNTHSGDFMIPNSDSIGFYPGLSFKEACTAINFCLGSRSLVELSGWLHKDTENKLMPYLKKACCCPKNGEDVFFGDFDFKQSNSAPAIWYLKSPHFSRDSENPCLPVRTISIFNWDEEIEEFKIDAATCELDVEKAYIFKDFWSDEIFELQSNGYLDLAITPHHSRLFSISELKPSPVILDSNIQLNNVKIHEKTLRAEINFRGQAELFLNFLPEKIISGHSEINFTSIKVNNKFKTYLINHKINELCKKYIASNEDELPACPALFPKCSQNRASIEKIKS